MTTSIHLIDAFTGTAFTGNPAGVVLLADERTEAWMQAVALEMNQAETAFLRLGPDGFLLRWFTPAAEVDLCGHALSQAPLPVGERAAGADEPARFHTAAGVDRAA